MDYREWRSQALSAQNIMRIGTAIVEQYRGSRLQNNGKIRIKNLVKMNLVKKGDKSLLTLKTITQQLLEERDCSYHRSNLDN